MPKYIGVYAITLIG